MTHPTQSQSNRHRSVDSNGIDNLLRERGLALFRIERVPDPGLSCNRSYLSVHLHTVAYVCCSNAKPMADITCDETCVR